MNNTKRIFLLLLSYAPISSVAVAAQSKISEIEGEVQLLRLQQTIDGARFRILPNYQMTSSIADAKKRYHDLTGLTGAQLEYSFAADLDNLASLGLIQFDEKKILAMGPSEYAAH
ncbi:MAG: hypothetical protein ACK5Y2_08285 [Bdellovibrionales bacterium]